MSRSTHWGAPNLALLAALAGCSGEAGPSSPSPKGSPDAGSTTGPSAPTSTLRSSTGAECVISADCGAGSYCDLGECVQDCSSERPCAAGATCSARGRCLAPGAPDRDPEPAAEHAGDLQVEPVTTQIVASDATFSIKLTSTSPEPVRYRVVVNAPHLRVSEPRGSFVGQTTLTFAVDAAAAQGTDGSGSVRLFTTLGHAVVAAPIQTGISGSYQGTLRYDGGLVPLGEARLALDLLEKNGDVRARVDSARSLLFPAVASSETTGRGTFAPSAGLTLFLSQSVPKSVGGARNHFQRDLGRRLRLELHPVAGGHLEGTFTESVLGLFGQPVTTSGHVVLRYAPHAQVAEFELGEDPAMPAGNPRGFIDIPEVNAWAAALASGTTCSTLCPIGPAATPDDLLWPQLAYEGGWTQHLPGFGAPSSPKSPATSSAPGSDHWTPFHDVVEACRRSASSSLDAWQTDVVKADGGALNGTHRCSFTPGLACTLNAAAKLPMSNPDAARRFEEVFASTVAAPLLVAKDDVVQALYASFADGIASEGRRYDDAVSVLSPVGTWALQPGVLEAMRSMVPAEPYAAVAAFSDLLVTLSAVEGERARVHAASGAPEATGGKRDAQERALISYLESLAVVEVLRSWGTAPPRIGSRFTGVLTPLDRGFGALLHGANALGLPAGFVPFIYRPEDAAKGATNFEQMMIHAEHAADAQGALQASFLANMREYEANQQSLRNQFEAIRVQFDQRLKSICGTDFDPDAVANATDWQRCGTQAGELADLKNQIAEAMARLQSAESRIQGMKDKIAIDRRALAETQKVREDSVRFIDRTGRQLESIAFSEGVINATQKIVAGMSNSVTTFGASVGTGFAEAALEMARAGLQVQRQRLQTAQQMQAERANASIEWINGMANIQRELIDLAQLGVDIHQDAIALAGAHLRAANLLSEAQSWWNERRRALAIADSDPAHDPTFRILRDKEALGILASRARAQEQLYLAGRALEYEINTPIPTLAGAVLRAGTQNELSALGMCFSEIFRQWRLNVGNPQDYPTTVSIRKLLGITGPRIDSVTGELWSEGDQFRNLLLRNENLDGRGSVTLSFSTNLQPGNGLWATTECADRITMVEAQLVGDFLGDNQARIEIVTSGDAVMRSCSDDSLTTWSFSAPGSIATEGVAHVQAGVNGFGDAPPNSSLFGQSVARASWKIRIPNGLDVPDNADLDLTRIDDIVLRIHHKAVPRRSSVGKLDLSCLGG